MRPHALLVALMITSAAAAMAGCAGPEGESPDATVPPEGEPCPAYDVEGTPSAECDLATEVPASDA